MKQALYKDENLINLANLFSSEMGEEMTLKETSVFIVSILRINPVGCPIINPNDFNVTIGGLFVDKCYDKEEAFNITTGCFSFIETAEQLKWLFECTVIELKESDLPTYF